MTEQYNVVTWVKKKVVVDVEATSVDDAKVQAEKRAELLHDVDTVYPIDDRDVTALD